MVLPAGYSGTVTVRWAGFWYWRVFDLISLAGIAATVVFWVRRRRQVAEA